MAAETSPTVTGETVTTERVTARFVITLGGPSEAEAELEWLARMAQRLRCELMALTIEDENADRLANLPCSRLISRSSGRALALDAMAMRRAARVAALRQRQRLELAARELGLRLAAEERALPAAEAASTRASDLARLGPGDILTLLHLGADPLELPAWALAAPDAMAAIVRPRGRGLALVYRDNPEAVAVAESVMEHERLPLRVILIGGEEGEEAAPGAIEALRGRWPASVAIEWRRGAALEGLGARLAALRPRLLLLDRIGNVAAAGARP